MTITRRTFLQTATLAALAPNLLAQKAQTKVVLLLTGVINDGGWSQYWTFSVRGAENI